MEIQIKKINVPYLTSIIKKMLLMDAAIYLNINDDRIWSDVYTPTKDIVKSNWLPVKDVLTFDEPIGETIKLSFFSGVRFLNCLSLFDPHNLSATINAFKDEDDNTIYAEKIMFADGRLYFELLCQDISLGFTSMTSDQVKRAFDSTSKKYEFKLSSEEFSKILSLMPMDKSELLKLYTDSKGVHIKTEAFDLIVDDNYTKSQKESNFFKSFLSKVDKENYIVSVCDSKLILQSEDSNTSIALNLAITD